MMTTLLDTVVSGESLAAFALAVAVFGFCPGFLLRTLVRIYPADDPRRRELPAELYSVPRLVRPFWVAEQLETVLHEGAALRYRTRRTRKLANRIARDGLAALDAEAVRAIEESAAADDEMVFVDLGSATLVAQRVGAVRRGELRTRRERLRAAVRWALLSRQRKTYIRALRLRLTARVGPPTSTAGDYAGEPRAAAVETGAGAARNPLLPR